MPSLCSITWCPNYSRATQRPNVRYYCLPTNDAYNHERRAALLSCSNQKWRKWILQENRMHYKLRQDARVCADHFKPSVILCNKRLAPGAIPSIGQSERYHSSESESAVPSQGIKKEVCPDEGSFSLAKNSKLEDSLSEIAHKYTWFVLN